MSKALAGSSTPVTPAWYREVLGQYPTGVAVVTAIDADQAPVGLAVGTFTSVSLEPPLVGFLPARTSRSWPHIEAAGRFCINILGADQEDVCRIFASKETDKFRDLRWRAAGSGSPIIEGSVAWIDCDLESAHDAGDHVMVVGRVRRLELERPGEPLIFFQGGYGRFSAGSLASGDGGFGRLLRIVDVARPEMERIARELDARCLAVSLVGDELVLLASAGHAGHARPQLIGQRAPAVPALGTLDMAYAEDSTTLGRWLEHVPSEGEREELRARLAQVRDRGYSIGVRSPLHDAFERMLSNGEIPLDPRRLSPEHERILRSLPYDPIDASLDPPEAVRSIHAPVFGADGRVAFGLNLFLASHPARGTAELGRCVTAAVEAARRVTAATGGRVPDRLPTTIRP